MAGPNEVGGWVIDPMNPNRATYTDEYGDTYEVFRQELLPVENPTPLVDPLSGNEKAVKGEVPYYKAPTEASGLAKEAWDYTVGENVGIDQSNQEVFKEYSGLLYPLVQGGWTALEGLGGGINAGIAGGTELLGNLFGIDPSNTEDLARSLVDLSDIGGLFAGGHVPTTGPRRFTPDVEAQYVDLLKSGSVDEIKDFVSQQDGFSVNDVEIEDWVKTRGLQDPANAKAVYADPLEAKLAEEAASFKPKAEPTVEDLFPTEEGQALKQQAMEAKLQAEADAFLAGRKDAVEAENPAGYAAEESLAEQAKRVRSEAEQADVDDATAHLNNVTKDWKNAPEFQIVNSLDEIEDAELRSSIDPDAIGVTTPDGRVVINLRNVDSPETLSAVTFHEGLGHHGLAQKFGEELDQILEYMYANSKGFQSDVDNWMKNNPDAYGDDINPLARAAEEVLAEMSEGGRITPTLMDRFKNWLKQYAREIGITLDFSHREIKTILGMAHDATINGKRGDVIGNGFRYAKRPKITRSKASSEPDRFSLRAAEVLAPKQEAARTFLRELGVYSVGEMRGWSADEVITRAERLGIDKQWVEYFNDRRRGIDTPQPDMSRYLPNVKYMKRVSGKGSEGPLQGGSTKEGNELRLGRFRSQNKLEEILAENAPEFTPEKWDDWIDEAAKVRYLAKAAKGLEAGSTPAQILAAREGIIKSANRIANLSRKAAAGELTEREQYQLLAEMARNADMQDALAGVRSNAARVVNSFKITVETDAAFTDAVRAMMKHSNNAVLADPANRQKFFQQIANAANNQDTVNKLVKTAFKPKAEDYIFRVWYNMLLSSPATHVSNFVGTGANFVVDLLENTGASVLGQGKRFSNADRVRGREVAYRVYGALKAMRDSQTWKNAGASYMSGQTGNMANVKAGATNVYTGTDKAAKTASVVLEAPTRSLASADEWWRNVLQLSNFYGLAVRNAGNKGLKGKAFWSEVDNLVNNPTKEMIDATNDYTKVIQFMDKPSWIGRGLINAQQVNVDSGIPERLGKGVLKVAVPFINTPDALIRTALRRSPLGWERENVNGWKAGGAQRDVVKSRLIMGSMLSFWLANQALEGTITGAGPSDLQKKQEWLGSHQPNSIKVGDEWFSIAGLEPVSTNITAIATLVERYKAGEISDEDYAKSALMATQGIGAVLSENSYLEGFKSLMDISADDPNKAQNALTNFVANIASSATTPAILRKYTQSQDTAIRDTTGDGSVMDRISGRIASAVPGLAEQLPQKYDVYGRPQERNFAGPDFVSRTQTRMKEDDPVVIELSRLAETTDKVLVGPPSKSNVKVNGEAKRLTAEEFQKYQYLSGYWIVESLRQEMQSPEWELYSDEEKIDIITDIKKDMRQAAREALFNPEGEDLPEEELDEEGEE